MSLGINIALQKKSDVTHLKLNREMASQNLLLKLILAIFFNFVYPEAISALVEV